MPKRLTTTELLTMVGQVHRELLLKQNDALQLEPTMAMYKELYLATQSARALIADLGALKMHRAWDLDDSERVRLANLDAGPLPTMGECVRVGEFTTLDEALGGLPRKAKKCTEAEYDEAVAAHAANSEEEG